MINVQDLLNDLYFNHGFQHDTVYDHGRFYTHIKTSNVTISVKIAHNHLSTSKEVLLTVTDLITELSFNRRYKTQKGITNKILFFENQYL